MMTSLLRPLTLIAVGTLLMTSPLAGAAPSTTAARTSGDLDRRTTSVPLPVTGLPTGVAPKIAYARATKPAFLGGNFRLHRTDGSTSRLGFLALGQWSTTGRGVIGIAATEVGPQLQRVDAHGRVVRHRFLKHAGLAVSPDHTIVSWLDDRGRPHDLEGRGSRELTLPRVAQGEGVGAVWGAGTCQEQAPEGGGCTVFVNAARNRGVFVSTSHGIVDRTGPMLHVADVNHEGRVTGLVSRATPARAACWGVFGPGGHRAWQTCRYRLDTFTDGGRRVLGLHGQATWDSINRFAIFRHDGSIARAYTFRPGPERSLNGLTWEDPTHLLGVLRVGGSWSIIRIGVDGTVEYAVPPVPAVNEFTPFALPVR